MNIQEHELFKFLCLLDELGCLQYVMLIGSWAEFLYEKTGLLKGFIPNIKTMDIDFLVRNMRKPVPEVQVATEARPGLARRDRPNYGRDQADLIKGHRD